jgi:hypothetical protein
MEGRHIGFPGSGAFVSQSPLSQALVGRRCWNDDELLVQLEKMVQSSEEIELTRQNYRKEDRHNILMMWQAFVKRETQDFGECSFFYYKHRNLPQPEPWEGNEEGIRHIIQQQDKQVIEYAKMLETRRKGNYLPKAVG